ncbi:hypothetical protein DFJ73DRAFT_825253 [Zopfochytrium polystomum]|nr:hypothetical protein DFJ73DRAFT_825253 [Zopfochytrium polystomum]
MEERVLFLERALAPAGAQDPAYAIAEQSTRPGFESVLATVQTVQAKLRRIADDRRAIAEFLQKYVSLKDLLQNQTNELDSGGLDATAKKEIVLAADEEILQAAEYLKELDGLKGEVNSNALNGLNAYMVALRPIEVQQIEQSKISSKMKERFISLINDYNNYVSTLSQVFLHYDNLISTLEREFSGR